jgi:hypothetical protein
VQGALLAVVHPGDTPAGYNLTFAFPMLMFIIVAGALFLLFRGSHDVPGHVALTSSRWVTGGGTGTVNFGEDSVQASVEPGATPETEAHLAEAVPTEPETTAEPAAESAEPAAESAEPAAESAEPAAAAEPREPAEGESAQAEEKDTEDGE